MGIKNILFLLLFIIITQFLRLCAEFSRYNLNFVLFDLVKHFAISVSGRATKISN